MSDVHEALDIARQKIMAMDAELTRLKSAPLVYATVVKADNKFRLDAFEKGDPMVVIDPQVRKNEHKQFGRITSNGADEDGWVILEFTNGDRDRLNIGITGMPQVKLVGKDDGMNVVIALGGQLYEVHGIPNKALQPAEQVKVDMESRQIHDTTGISSGGEVAFVKSVIDEGDDLELHEEYGQEEKPKTGIFGVLQRARRKTTVSEKAKEFAESESESDGETEVSEFSDETVYLEGQVPHVEVEVHGRDRVVLHGKPDHKLEPGDRVMLDQSSTIIVRVLEQADKDEFTMVEPSPVTWNDIAGCEHVRETLEELIVLPFTAKDQYAYYGKSTPKGGMMYGPPGCGKTMSAKAISNRFAEIHGSENFQSGFIYVKGPELLHWHVGRTEFAVRQLFARGKAHYQKHGYPALLFIDEADAILPMRGSGKSSDVENTIVPMFLGEMDGLEESHLFVLLATNQPRRLDPAVVREGRCEESIKVRRPTQSSAVEYFDVHLRNIPIAEGQDKAEIIAVTVADLFAGHRNLYDIGHKQHPGQTMPFNLSDCVTGAMIKGICEQATTNALKRDITNGTTGGVVLEDFRKSVERTYQSHKDTNPTFDLEDFFEANNISSCDAVVKAC